LVCVRAIKNYGQVPKWWSLTRELVVSSAKLGYCFDKEKSDVSALATETKRRALIKHYFACRKLISGNNWIKYTDFVHKKLDSSVCFV